MLQRESIFQSFLESGHDNWHNTVNQAKATLLYISLWRHTQHQKNYMAILDTFGQNTWVGIYVHKSIKIFICRTSWLYQSTVGKRCSPPGLGFPSDISELSKASAVPLLFVPIWINESRWQLAGGSWLRWAAWVFRHGLGCHLSRPCSRGTEYRFDPMETSSWTTSSSHDLRYSKGQDLFMEA